MNALNDIKKGLMGCLILSAPLSVQAMDRVLSVTVKNPLKMERTNEPVVIDIAGQGVLTARVMQGDSLIPCQLDDRDGDLRPDELVFLTNIGKKEELTFRVVLSDEDAPKILNEEAPRMYADLLLSDKDATHPRITTLEAPGESALFNAVYEHGALFESELTGWRVYFDNRQNIDLYGKSQRRIELPVTQFYSTAEQMAEGYGNDVLWAGNSIGAGSLKLWDGQQPVNWNHVVRRSQRIVASGPLRTVVELKDLGVQAPDGTRSSITQYYIMYAGHRDCTILIHVEGEPTQLVTGVQKVGATPEGWAKAEEGLAASWGADYPDMGKKDLYAPEAVGLAVCVPTAHVAAAHTDELNYLLTLKTNEQGDAHYSVSFCADKEQEGYHSAKEWFKSLNDWKKLLDAPLQITVTQLSR
jgi:hypothetical protein